MRTFDKPREKRQPRSTDHGPRTNQPTTDFYPVSPHPRVNNALTPRRIPTNFANTRRGEIHRISPHQKKEKIFVRPKLDQTKHVQGAHPRGKRAAVLPIPALGFKPRRARLGMLARINLDHTPKALHHSAQGWLHQGPTQGQLSVKRINSVGIEISTTSNRCNAFGVNK
jgi:hypothetical protein